MHSSIVAGSYLSQSLVPYLNVQGITAPVTGSVLASLTLPQKNAFAVSGHFSPFAPQRFTNAPAPLFHSVSFDTVVWLAPGTSVYHCGKVCAVVWLLATGGLVNTGLP